MASLPDEYCRDLAAIVLTETGVTGHRRDGHRPRVTCQATTHAAYHRARRGEPAWIELVVDQILKDLPKPLDRIPVARDIVVGRVLFHEIGHHLDATLGPIERSSEDSAEAWEARLTTHYVRQRYGYLRPFTPALKLLARLAKAVGGKP